MGQSSNGVLWIINLPLQSKYNYVDSVVGYIKQKLCHGNVFLLFDQCYVYSIKSGMRISRAGKQASRCHKVTADTPLLPQVVLTVTSNYVYTINIICKQLFEKVQMLQLVTEDKNEHSLILTASNSVLIRYYPAYKFSSYK